MDWDTAFLEQSRADWKALEIIKKAKAEKCHYLHYLQMTTEKLAKAVDARALGGKTEPKRSHKSLVRQLQTLPRNVALQELLGIPCEKIKSIVDGILPLATKVEALSPDLAQNGPNPEYPWKDPRGVIHCPAKHVFLVWDEMGTEKGQKLLWILELMLNQFRRVFGGSTRQTTSKGVA